MGIGSNVRSWFVLDNTTGPSRQSHAQTCRYLYIWYTNITVYTAKNPIQAHG